MLASIINKSSKLVAAIVTTKVYLKATAPAEIPISNKVETNGNDNKILIAIAIQ